VNMKMLDEYLSLAETDLLAIYIYADLGC
jgi:hypothetical protein